jgi:hypothetical protein
LILWKWIYQRGTPRQEEYISMDTAESIQYGGYRRGHHKQRGGSLGDTQGVGKGGGDTAG